MKNKQWSPHTTNLRSGSATLMTHSPSLIAVMLTVFLHHLNSQQPAICFTMETEKESKFAFLDTSVSREPDGRLTTSVYRKPTHTDQYLAYDSHHPQSVKRVIVKCLYDRAKRLVPKPSVISRKRNICHLSLFLTVSLFLRTEAHQEKKSSPQERARARVHRGFAVYKSKRISSPLPTTTRYSRHL